MLPAGRKVGATDERGGKRGDPIMATSEQQHAANVSIPKITCPQCGARMSLARIELEGPDNRDRMFFECVCGFDYRLSQRANDGR